MKRAIQNISTAGLLLLVVTAALLFAHDAQAKIGLAMGFGPRFPHPGTIKVGPVYYAPGDKATAAAATKAENAPTELSQFLDSYKRKAHKVKCAKMHADYVGRHGLTTPRPLKGSSGCAKYARDEAYWQSRRGERVSLTSPGNAVAYAAHNAVLPW